MVTQNSGIKLSVHTTSKKFAGQKGCANIKITCIRPNKILTHIHCTALPVTLAGHSLFHIGNSNAILMHTLCCAFCVKAEKTVACDTSTAG